MSNGLQKVRHRKLPTRQSNCNAEGVNNSTKHWRHSLVTDDNGRIYSITVNERPKLNPKYSMTNYYNAYEGNDCLDLWGN